MGLGVGIGIWVARYLEPDKFGIISYAQSIAFIIAAISGLGLDGILVRDLVKKPFGKETILGTSFYLRAISSLFCLLVLAIGVALTEKTFLESIVILIIASSSVFQSLNVIESFYQSEVLSKYSAIANSLATVLLSFVKVVLIISNQSLIWFALVAVLDMALPAIFLLIAYTKISRLNILLWEFNLKEAMSLLTESWRLLFAGLCFAIFTNADVIIVGNYLGQERVGIYASAYKLSSIWYFIPGLVINSFVPMLVQCQGDAKRYERYTAIITGSLMWGAIGLGIVGTFFSSDIINVTYGTRYLESAQLLSMLIWINVFIFFNSCWGQWKIINGQSSYVLRFHFLTALSNVVFNLVLVPVMGLNGSVIAIIFSLFLTTMYFMWADKSMRQLLIRAASLNVVHA